MTRKDYIALARAIQDAGCYDDGEPCGMQIILNIADVLARDNDRFNRDKFLEACGLSVDEREAA